MASAYKAREKRFKQLSDAQVRADAELIDVDALTPEQQAHVAPTSTWRWRNDDGDRERPVLSFGSMGDAHKGFFLIRDAIDAATQLEIAHACLTEYVEPPHVTNMHQQNQQVEGIWKKARQSHPHEPAASPVLSKLHWGAAGYHYDWTARKYYPQDYSPVPQRLAALGQQCAEACGETLEAEAVIVNFYKKSSTMGGHQDDVEDTMAHPVVSLSLGSDCVFLKGTCTKEDAPLEVLLRSGDLAVLSGNSRLSYHGVAKVLPREFAISDQEVEALVAKKMKEECNEEGERAADEWRGELRAVKRYLETHRININIRQVYERPGDPAAEAEQEPVVSLPAETNTEGGEEAHVSKRQKVCAK